MTTGADLEQLRAEVFELREFLARRYAADVRDHEMGGESARAGVILRRLDEVIASEGQGGGSTDPHLSNRGVR